MPATRDEPVGAGSPAASFPAVGDVADPLHDSANDPRLRARRQLGRTATFRTYSTSWSRCCPTGDPSCPTSSPLTRVATPWSL